jgi:hypothetical protein
MDYRIIESQTPEDLENLINDIIVAGGKTVGGVCVDSRMTKIYQAAMVPTDYSNSEEYVNNLHSTTNSAGGALRSTPATATSTPAVASRMPVAASITPAVTVTSALGGRIRQTARKSTGGKPPHKLTAFKSLPLRRSRKNINKSKV